LRENRKKMEDKEKLFEGKKVYIVLKSGRRYKDGFSIIDKFGKHVYISKTSVEFIEEEGGR
jgi:hypothetical protein